MSDEDDPPPSGTSSLTTLPAPSLSLPSRGDEYVPVRVHDWARLRQRVASLNSKERHWANAGWALVGIGTSALVSWLPILVSGQFNTKVGVITLVVGAASLALGVGALLVARESGISTGRTVTLVEQAIADMESHLDTSALTRIRTLSDHLDRK